jgi:2-polyprenyl-6-methoxyphenol hydroxylase-like FAD-dependent oxidoreductase
MMPQWDFLNFIALQGRRFPQFQLRMQAGVTHLLEENGRVVGVRAKTPAGELEVRADLTVGADGRNSTVRQQAGFEVIDRGAPIDVLWMRIPRHPEDPARAMGRFNAGKALAMLYRGDYWQCAYLIPKGEFGAIQQAGLPAFREDLATVMPFVRDRIGELKSWDDIKLLSVRVDYLRQWWLPGLLCIGDAAHAMSPAGGVGINLAIQDAVAAANILAGPLLRGAAIDEHLAAVQKRREFPTRIIQWLQIFAHKRMISRALAHTDPLKRMPLPLKLFQWFPVLRRIPARMIGVGFRPEHVRTPDARG